MLKYFHIYMMGLGSVISISIFAILSFGGWDSGSANDGNGNSTLTNDIQDAEEASQPDEESITSNTINSVMDAVPPLSETVLSATHNNLASDNPGFDDNYIKPSGNGNTDSSLSSSGNSDRSSHHSSNSNSDNNQDENDDSGDDMPDDSFFVLPESPIGSIAVALSSLAVLGLFFMQRGFRARRTLP